MKTEDLSPIWLICLTAIVIGFARAGNTPYKGNNYNTSSIEYSILSPRDTTTHNLRHL